MNKTTKRWLAFIATALIVFIIANAINILFIQREPEIPATSFVQTNADNSTSTFSEVSFSATPPSFPQELPIATTQQFTTSENDIAEVIIDQFNLTAHPAVPKLWTSNDWSLSNAVGDLFTLSSNQYSELTDIGMNQETTVQIAQNFIDSYFKQLNLDVIESQIIYYENFLEPDESNSENAQIAKIPFSYTIAGYPVFYEQKSLFPFEVWVTVEDSIQKFTYYPQFIQVREIGNKPLISIDQAIENINQLNQGSVVSYNNSTTTVISLEEVTQADMNSVKIEYRVDPSTNYAFPFYRFSGTALLSGIETPIEITTPAVVVQ